MELTHIIKALVVVLVIVPPVSSQFNFFIENCHYYVGNYTTNSTFKTNLNLLLPNLIALASSDPIFSNYSVGEQGIDKAYGLYMCRGDLDTQKCHDCVEAASTTILQKCPVQKEAIVWYQECMVRYANRSIFSLEEQYPPSWLILNQNVTDAEKFGEALRTLMDGLINQAANNETNRGYAIGNIVYTGVLKIYEHVQCTPDILGFQCERCIQGTFNVMEDCCGIKKDSNDDLFTKLLDAL